MQIIALDQTRVICGHFQSLFAKIKERAAAEIGARAAGGRYHLYGFIYKVTGAIVWVLADRTRR